MILFSGRGKWDGCADYSVGADFYFSFATMQGVFDYWEFLAGIGLFLWGMSQVEQGLKGLAGNSFKDLLHRYTNKPWKGIVAGTLVTAILQSSSLVTLMVLAFLGGGMIHLRNALGVVLGANMGTTFTAWIVATFGFKLSVADFAFPFLAIGVMTYLFTNSRPFLKYVGIFLLGFGLLFLGLDYMKVSIDTYAAAVDLSTFGEYGRWRFLLLGILITAMIQSSSAMIVIVLSAINAGLIGTDHALAMIIGANIGTTFTLVLGAVGGTADKKRLALANFMFNGIVGVLCFFWIDELILLSIRVFQLTDPLFELVLLNSLINGLMILGFYPFLLPLEAWLKRRFRSDIPKGKSQFVKNISTEIPSVALIALRKEMDGVLQNTLKLVWKIVHKHKGPRKDASVWRKITFQPKDLLLDYQQLKNLEEELFEFALRLQAENLRAEEANRLSDLSQTLRFLVVGAKEFKDIVHNLKEMEDATEPFVAEVLADLQEEVKDFLTVFEEYQALAETDTPTLQAVEEKLKATYSEKIHSLYSQLRTKKTDVPVSTLANVIQQVFSGLGLIWKGIGSMQKEVPEETAEVR
ncbi:phosphate:Na+ symporter [Cyclobacterium xiamenense]|uniref:Phosphate:Na+ symporter n=2 Tax=Cyclobacterium xiamenense TaxID=1297121 RepID=A0A1H6YX07_9BACT|nr:phosphate:Na+ symporter [Cyclobacterium xiamenense]